MNTNKPNKELSMEHLQVRVYDNRKEMGFAAGKAVASRIRELLQMQELVTMIFAAAPSQNEFLQTLVSEPGIDWKKVIALHMDEYIGLPENSPQHFRNYLEEHPVDIVCCGIGENGHLAFNDPPVADFLDPQIVKVVELEKICRQQQVNDGCFPSLDHVPTHALSLTIPALLSGRYIYCMVPGSAKAAAVRDTLFGPITTSCPASILRRHFRVVLYLDTDSAAQL